MKLERRIELMSRLGDYILHDNTHWPMVKEEASRQNPWFLPEFVERATTSIALFFLEKGKLQEWASIYKIPSTQSQPKTIGLVMAGNIPLVGFHDFLSVFISGHQVAIKLSARDEVLLKHLVSKLAEWDEEVSDIIDFREMLKGCDAYIATGSNNSARYFERYFGKYPHIIRRNRTSVAILDGTETNEELEKLADDVYMYFGLGCRNVTKIYVPRNYEFSRLLEVFRKYNYLADNNKYKNNYDYNLAILILNKQVYMTNDSILLSENPSSFSPISQLYYEFYDVKDPPILTDESLQCIIARDKVPFGVAQSPGLCDYADGFDTLQFLLDLKR